MLFCAGIGAGMLYWATIEWGFYIDNPPFGVAPRLQMRLSGPPAMGFFIGALLVGLSIACQPSLLPIHFMSDVFLTCVSALPALSS